MLLTIPLLMYINMQALALAKGIRDVVCNVVVGVKRLLIIWDYTSMCYIRTFCSYFTSLLKKDFYNWSFYFYFYSLDFFLIFPISYLFLSLPIFPFYCLELNHFHYSVIDHLFFSFRVCAFSPLGISTLYIFYIFEER